MIVRLSGRKLYGRNVYRKGRDEICVERNTEIPMMLCRAKNPIHSECQSVETVIKHERLDLIFKNIP